MRYGGIATLQVPNKRHKAIRKSAADSSIPSWQGEYYNTILRWSISIGVSTQLSSTFREQMRKYGGTSLSCEDHLKSHIVSSSKFLLHQKQCALNTAVAMSSSYVNVKLLLCSRVDSIHVKWLKADTNFGRPPAGRVDVTSKT